MVREDFLQQNAFMDVDSYSSHDRQMRLLALILDYDKLAREALTFQQFYAPGGKLRLRLPPVRVQFLLVRLHRRHVPRLLLRLDLIKIQPAVAVFQY